MNDGEVQPVSGAGDVLTGERNADGRRRAEKLPERDIVDILFVAGVSFLAIAAAIVLFISANADPDLLWRGYYHDRNGHYAFGQALALAVRTGDPVWFFGEILKAQAWPPVHGLVLAAVLLVGGIDHRLGIVPSLLGWATTIIFTALIARRMLKDRDLGITAAVIAVTLGVASPAFRLLACDVMLECLGAGLTAAALWAYGRAMTVGGAADAAETAKRWRLLAIILTLLFFEKGNYWGLTIGGLAAAYLLNDNAHELRRLFAASRHLFGRWDAPTIVRALCDPFIIIAVLLIGLVSYLYERGPTSVFLLGRSVSLYPPENLVTVTYAVLFARCARWWFKHRPARDAALGPAGCALFYWHIAPLAVSFLFPHRLSVFVNYVGPADTTAGFDLIDGVAVYWRAFADGFNSGPWAAILTLGLFVIGLSQVRRFSPGGRAAFALALISCAGVIIHPLHNGRFLASWLFAVWICAGGGGAILVEWLIPKRARLATAGAIGIAIASAMWRSAPAAAYPVANYLTSGPSDLDLVRPVLPDIAGLRFISYATTFGQGDLLTWMAREKCLCKLQVENPWIFGYSRQQVREQMAERLASSRAEAFVLIDLPTRYYELPVLGWTEDNMAGIIDAFAAQKRYVRAAAHPVPQFGAEDSVWRLNIAPAPTDGAPAKK